MVGTLPQAMIFIEFSFRFCKSSPLSTKLWRSSSIFLALLSNPCFDVSGLLANAFDPRRPNRPAAALSGMPEWRSAWVIAPEDDARDRNALP